MDNTESNVTEERGLQQRLRDATKVFAPLGSIIGLVTDLLHPLAPILHVVTVICGIISIILFIFYLLRKRKEIYNTLSGYFSQFFIFTAVLIVFWILSAESQKGILADNFEVFSDLQQFLIKESTSDGVDSQPIPIFPDSVAQANTYHIDISNNLLRVGKSSVENQIVNGLIYHKNGHYDLAALTLDSAISQGVMKYDLLLKYYEAMFYNMKGDTLAVQSRIESAGLADNQLMSVARIDFLYKGIKYYKALSQISITEPGLLAFAQNLKAKSLFADLHHYYQYESFALEHWVPLMRKNEKMLGKNLIYIRDYFFDFHASYQSYMKTTTHETDDHFVWDWPIADPNKKSNAAMIWKRILSGEVNKVILNLNQTVTGKVVDAEGNPISNVLVSDFDSFPKISSPEVFTGITTDEFGTFSLTSGLGHLLRFRFIGNGQRYKEVFQIVDPDTAMTIVLK